MTSLLEDFHLLRAELEGSPEELESTSLLLARQVLMDYPKDPGFWVQYADICRARDDFSEASAALEQAESLIDEERSRPSTPPALPVLLDFLQWRKTKILAELLKVMARGNPALQPELIRVLRQLAGLSYEDICKRLEGAMLLEPDAAAFGLDASAIWMRNLDRIHQAMIRPGQSDPDYQTDLEVLQDLATALMGAGQFAEAAQLFTEPPYSQFITDNPESSKVLKWYPTLIQWLRAFLQDPFNQVELFQSPGHRYVIAMVVWGDAFLDALEQFPLPSLLAPGNLPYLQQAGEVHTLFFTTEAGALRLKQMPAFQAVEGLVSTDIVVFPNELTASRGETYKLMSAMHLASMEVAKASHAHFFFLAPDIVLADNFLKVIDQTMRQGAEVVFVPGVMLQMESFAEEQAQRFPPIHGVLSIAPKDLLDLGLRHVHPFAKQAYTYSPRKRRPSASVLMWPLLDERGYLIHGFHHTPYLVSAKAMQRFDGSLFFTIDGEFLLKIIRTQEDLDRCVLLTDLEETNYFELSRGTRFDFPLEFDMARLCRWGSLQGLVAKWLAPQKVCLCQRETAAEDPACSASAEVVDEILRGMEGLETGLFSSTPILPIRHS